MAKEPYANDTTRVMKTEDRLKRFLSVEPNVERAAFIAENAIVLGDVALGDDSSIWYGAILRADINFIRIGKASNLQDGTIVHLSDDFGVVVGDFVTVGHRAILHACRIGDETLIGMGSTVLDGAEIGNQCIVGANSLVKQGLRVPDGSLVYGNPARIVRPLDRGERSKIRLWAEKYIRVAGAHRARR